MAIFQKLAGYSLGQADMVRRAMSKKKLDKLAIEREAFINGDASRGITGCVVNNISSDVANELFDEMTEFAKYAFNQSHAAAYAMVAYQTAYLKYHYPAEYICSMFNNKEPKEYDPLFKDCKDFGIEILPPSINDSYYDFTVENGCIRYGFRGINEVGEKKREMIDKIVYIRNNNKNYSFVSLNDFLYKMAIPGENNTYTLPEKKIIENFIKVGAFDSSCNDRKNLLETFHSIMKHKPLKYDNLKNFLAENEVEKGLINKEYNWKEETELLNVIVSENPLKTYSDDETYNCVPINNLPKDKRVSIFGLVVNVECKLTKENKNMMKINVEGKKGNVTLMLFNNVYSKYKDKDMVGRIYKFTGKTSSNGEIIFCHNIERLRTSLDRYYTICDTKDVTRKMSSIINTKDLNGSVVLNMLVYYGGKADNLHKLEYPIPVIKTISIDTLNKIKEITSVKMC